MSNHEILLYYKYVDLPDAEEVTAQHKQLCQELGLTGRVIIAKEGINGTVEGTVENTKIYMDVVTRDPRFADIQFKRSEGNGNAFPKLSVKYRDEIVSLQLGDQDFSPTRVTGKYLSADELHDWIHTGKEIYIVDMRNDYEHQVGHFQGSILPPMGNFRELPEVLPQLEHLKDKTVVTVCTGGVRCEKASGYLVQNDFNDVYQLKDGIVTYMEKYPNEDFVGQLYVFDGRVTMGFNLDDPKRQVIGKCGNCGAASEEYVNCANLACHKHFIVCQNCREEDGSAFCIDCKSLNS
jgi:UPF0176 protein